MKKLARAVGVALGLSLLTFAPLAADSCCADPCNDCCWDPCGWDGDFELGVHALYWKPIHCPLHYATREFSNGAQVNEVKDLKSDYDWGVRVFAGYQTDCTFVQVSYLYTNPTEHAKTEQGNANDFEVIGTPVGTPPWDFAQAQLNWEYQNVDVRLGQLLHRRCGCHFGVFGNFRWAYLERKQMIQGGATDQVNFPLETFSGTTNVRSKFDGAGLGVGARGEFSIWCGFNGFGELNVMGIIGDRRTPVVQNVLLQPITSPPGFIESVEIANFRSNTCVVPALDFRLGLNYTYDCWCTTLVAEVGYELNYYWNAIEAPLFTEDDFAPDAFNRQCTDIGFGGLFFGLRALF